MSPIRLAGSIVLFHRRLVVKPRPLSACCTALLVACCVSGCHTSSVNTPRSALPGEIPPELRRAEDARFSPSEQDIVAAARRYLEQCRGRTIDAYYKLQRTAQGYAVSVTFVTGYQNGRPFSAPGGHCTVLLGPDGTIIKVLPGS